MIRDASELDASLAGKPRTPAAVDVRSGRSAPNAWEAKSCQPDGPLLQEAVCQQFHRLISRQILFRRKEIR
jgi:hypothetical protein